MGQFGKNLEHKTSVNPKSKAKTAAHHQQRTGALNIMARKSTTKTHVILSAPMFIGAFLAVMSTVLSWSWVIAMLNNDEIVGDKIQRAPWKYDEERLFGKILIHDDDDQDNDG